MITLNTLRRGIEEGEYEAHIITPPLFKTDYIDRGGWKIAELTADGCPSSLGRIAIDRESIFYAKLKYLVDGSIKATYRDGEIVYLRRLDREEYWGD